MKRKKNKIKNLKLQVCKVLSDGSLLYHCFYVSIDTRWKDICGNWNVIFSPPNGQVPTETGFSTPRGSPLQYSALPLSLLDRWGAQDRPDGFIKHCLKAALCQSWALQVFHCTWLSKKKVHSENRLIFVYMGTANQYNSFFSLPTSFTWIWKYNTLKTPQTS